MYWSLLWRNLPVKWVKHLFWITCLLCLMLTWVNWLTQLSLFGMGRELWYKSNATLCRDLGALSAFLLGNFIPFGIKVFWQSSISLSLFQVSPKVHQEPDLRSNIDSSLPLLFINIKVCYQLLNTFHVSGSLRAWSPLVPIMVAPNSLRDGLSGFPHYCFMVYLMSQFSHMLPGWSPSVWFRIQASLIWWLPPHSQDIGMLHWTLSIHWDTGE